MEFFLHNVEKMLFLFISCFTTAHNVAIHVVARRNCWVARSHTHHTKSTYQSILNLYYRETRAASLFCFILKQKGRFSSALYTHINTQYVPTKIITLTHTQLYRFQCTNWLFSWNYIILWICVSHISLQRRFFIRNTQFYPKYVYGMTVKNHAYLLYENRIKRNSVRIIRNRQRNSTLTSIQFCLSFWLLI